MPSYLYLKNEADATDQEAISLNPKEIEILYQIRNHTTLEGFFSGKILKVWKDEGSKPIYVNTLKKLVNENLILVFPEFKFLKETNQLAVCLCLISEKEFKSSNREKLKENYQTAWELISKNRKNIVVDVNYSGPISGLEEKFVSEELKIIGENLNGLIPKTFRDFLIIANYISQKHDQERNHSASGEDLKSIKMLKTMMTMKSSNLSQFVVINSDEDREFSHSIVDNLRRDPDCISCDWYEKGKKMECFCSKKEDIIISLMKLMVEKYAFKKDTIRNFLYLLKKEKNNLGNLYQNANFKLALIQLKYSCYKENLSWFSKILNFLGIYKLLQTYLEHEESIVQLEQLNREIVYKENRKKQLEKIRAEWLREIEADSNLVTEKKAES
nr:hypothetical protein [Leptospira interrogans]